MKRGNKRCYQSYGCDERLDDLRQGGGQRYAGGGILEQEISLWSTQRLMMASNFTAAHLSHRLSDQAAFRYGGRIECQL